ncbi:MAG: putative ABC transporter permease [Oscillospiraceae bacterium]
MNMFLILAFLFAVGSVIGWTLELFYRRLFDPTNKERRWINPGFLTGPYLPLYGFSLIILFLLAQLEKYVPIENDVLRKLALFVVMAVCITIIEYFTGLIFIVKMKIKLWDYTENRGNVKGIICPLYSFFWMVLSAVYYFLINPYILGALKWLSKNLAFSFVIGFFFGVFVLDLVGSIKNLIKIRAFAYENEIVVFIEELKSQIISYREQKKEKGNFLLSFRSSDSIQNHLKRYKEMSANIEKLRIRKKTK